MKDYHPTFKQGRLCRHCSEPIADQAHGLQTFCEREVLPDGSVKSCKDDYHTARKKVVQKPYRVLSAFQKQMDEQVDALYKAHGESVSLEQVNRYGIQLGTAHKIELTGGLPTFCFTPYKIEQLSSSLFKIHPHDHVL